MYRNILEAAQSIRIESPGNWRPDPEHSEVVKQITHEFTMKSFGYDYRDLEQDLWLKVYEILSIRNTPSSSYLATCLRNVAYDFFRKEIKRKEVITVSGSFEGTSMEHHTPVSPGTPKMSGNILKTYLIAYHIHPTGLTLETREYIEKIYNQLTSREIETLNFYANEEKLSSKHKLSMRRLLEEYDEK